MWFGPARPGRGALAQGGARPQIHAQPTGCRAIRCGRCCPARANWGVSPATSGSAPAAGLRALARRDHPRPGHLARGGDGAVPRSPGRAVDRGQRRAGPAVADGQLKRFRRRRRAAAAAGAQHGRGPRAAPCGSAAWAARRRAPQRRAAASCAPSGLHKRRLSPVRSMLDRSQRRLLAQRRPFRAGAAARHRRCSCSTPGGLRRRDAVPVARGRRRRLLDGHQQERAARRRAPAWTPSPSGRRPGAGGDLLRHHRSAGRAWWPRPSASRRPGRRATGGCGSPPPGARSASIPAGCAPTWSARRW